MPSGPDVWERLRLALADRYRIEREIGSGGMAVVYLAGAGVDHHSRGQELLRELSKRGGRES
jgi:hypothetical protein